MNILQILGQIALFPYDFQPRGWMYCNGQTIPISEYDILFSLLGTKFGGDGAETFAVPNYSISDGCHYFISLEGMSRESNYMGIVGETSLWVTPDPPKNMVECTGQSIPSAPNRLLQQYLGTRFGNQGEQSIVLPDLRGYTPVDSRSLMLLYGDLLPVVKRQYYVGEILLLPDDKSYESLRICNGELLQVDSHMYLSRLLGIRFGGDGKKTFGLPDLRASAPPKFNYYINLKGIAPERS